MDLKSHTIDFRYPVVAWGLTDKGNVVGIAAVEHDLEVVCSDENYSVEFIEGIQKPPAMPKGELFTVPKKP